MALERAALSLHTDAPCRRRGWPAFGVDGLPHRPLKAAGGGIRRREQTAQRRKLRRHEQRACAARAVARDKGSAELLAGESRGLGCLWLWSSRRRGGLLKSAKHL